MVSTKKFYRSGQSVLITQLHRFLSWIIIQTHIRNTDSYSDTDSENLHISNQWFSLIVIKVSQRVANDQIIAGKGCLQKSVILSIIRGVSTT